MTLEELRSHFNNTFDFKNWPLTYQVDHETYANVCQSIFEFKSKEANSNIIPGVRYEIFIVIGRNSGIVFKGTELILKQK